MALEGVSLRGKLVSARGKFATDNRVRRQIGREQPSRQKADDRQSSAYRLSGEDTEALFTDSMLRIETIFDH